MSETSRASRIYHSVVCLFFGVAMPLGCLIFDPIVFRSGNLGGGMLGGYVIVGYLASGLGMVSITSWSLMRCWPAMHAGLLLGGALFAICLGLVLLPYSLFGLLLCIGIFGFMPFLVAWVFLREARAARREAISNGIGRGLIVLGFLIATTLPWAAHYTVAHEVRRATAQLASSDAIEVERAEQRLRVFRFLPHGHGQFENLVWEYRRETDPERREIIARAYFNLTGNQVESRFHLFD